MHLRITSTFFLLCSACSWAQNVIDDMSFGHKQTLSPNSFAIPGWNILGEGHVPQLLSDKVILTPPYGGNKRGALWPEKKNSVPEWQIDFEFRAGGQDRPGGNLQLWYAADGTSTVSTSSIYTVGRWDGFALVIDAVGGVQKIRGFLSDGSTEYRTHPNVESLAFGHCDYAYRNLGRPSKLQVKSTLSGLSVHIDDNLCFSSAQITLPTEYSFGITAASSHPPDSFEVFKFALSPSSSSSIPPPNPSDQAQQYQAQGDQQKLTQEQLLDLNTPSDTPASNYQTSSQQFEDLHSRLQLLSKSISNLFAELSRHTVAEETRYQEILRTIQTLQSQLPPSSTLNSLSTRLDNLDRQMSQLSNDLRNSNPQKQFDQLSAQLKETHNSVTEHVPARLKEYVIAHTPRIGFIVFSFLAFQSCLVGAYVWYKWRKNTMPKKYL